MILPAADYQQVPEVVTRVREFCGLDSEAGGCTYVSSLRASDGAHRTWGEVALHPPARLTELLAEGGDVVRSLWDRRSLIVYLDLDHRDARDPGDVYRHPAAGFRRLEPAWRAVRDSFEAFGMPMLDLVTGAGYAFVGCVDLDGAAAARLAELSPEPPAWLFTHPRRRPPWADASITATTARAWHGLGLVLEFFAHEVLGRVTGRTEVPVVIDNVEVGDTAGGRRSLSIDITSFGDPLDVRHLRVAFGAYQKHRFRPDLFGAEAARLPPLAVVPRAGRPLEDVIERGRSLAAAATLAAVSRFEIPNVESGLLDLVAAYRASALAGWHRDFYAVTPHPSTAWADTYGRLDPASLPPCVAAALEHPDDLLLEPTHLQLLVRTLMARGWHARHVAGLVRSYYERPTFWPRHWERVDPATRAEFDVRVFAGLIATGLDAGVDFNCVSNQERGLCPGRPCRHDLRNDRDRLLERRAS